MSWQQPGNRVHRTLLDPPEDGIALSRSSSGWLGRRLRAVVAASSGTASDRVRRGRNYARRGRARDLVVTTGTVSVDVFCDEVYRPSLRLKPLPSSAWRKVVDELSANLSGLAALLEGELPEDLVDRLARRGVSLVPESDELSGDCDCGDWATPCTHVATLLHLVAESLDGDPFLLLTLRGRSMEDLLSTLRERWGDDAAFSRARYASEEPVPDGDPFEASGGVPVLRSAGGGATVPLAGLRALGPAPDGADLLATLGPLYEAGCSAARDLLERVPERVPPRRRPRNIVLELPSDAPHFEEGASESAESEVPDEAPEVPDDAPEVPDDAPQVPDQAPAHLEGLVEPAAKDPVSESGPVASPPAAHAGERDLTGEVVATLASEDGLTSAVLAKRLDQAVSRVRRELVEMTSFGLVYPSRDEDGVQRWWLG